MSTAGAAVTEVGAPDRPLPVASAARGLLVVAVLGAVESVLLWNGLRAGESWAVENLLVVLALAAAGALLSRIPDQSRNGRLLVVTALLWSVTDLGGLGAGVAPTVQLAWVAGPWHLVPLAALLLRWPCQRLDRTARSYVLALAVVAGSMRLLESVTWNAAWTSFTGPWVYVGTSRSMYDAVARASALVSFPLVVLFVLLLVRHWRAM